MPYFGAGLGVDATTDVAEGEVLMRAPAAVWKPFSAAYAVDLARERAPGFYERAQSLSEQLGGHGEGGDLLSVAALSVQLVFGVSAPNPGTPYLGFLPLSIDTPLHWSNEQVDFLRGTDAHSDVMRRRQGLATIHSALFSAAGEGSPGVSLPAFAWAQSILLSRAVSGDGRPFTLCPLIDCVNHSWDPNARIVFDADAQEFSLVATKPIAAGSQVLISYGDMSSAALLRKYGFVLPNNPTQTTRCSPFFVPIPSALGGPAGTVSSGCFDPPPAGGETEDAVALRARKHALVNRLGLSARDAALHGATERTPPSADGLLDLCTVMCATASDLDALDAAAAEPSAEALQAVRRGRRELNQHVFTSALASVGMRLPHFPSTVAQDMEQLAVAAAARRKQADAMRSLEDGGLAEGDRKRLESARAAYEHATRRHMALALRVEQHSIVGEVFLALQARAAEEGAEMTDAHREAMQQAARNAHARSDAQ